ncbi:IS21 family transposase [Paraflavitalea speifideaquila]|uniref:IS21 family transposase n=1 Tax=Paraflavitalea speifideaquila TaxID=3076558 RepID=UPI0028EF5A1D|nr:IS21 family transposase [Paraflavitalea speifideiaquila]
MALTPYLSKLMTYHEVHRLSREGFSISYISNHLGLNWRTVKRLLVVEDDRDYEEILQRGVEKDCILDRYEVFIKLKLEQYPDTSSAQMHDWLKEHYPDLPSVSVRTVFNYVSRVRQRYQLVKTEGVRVYEMVPETPYGAQAQVDFGQYNMRNTQGGRVKVYFFTLVLSRSRYKYVFFSQEPFTAITAIEAHEHAFAFIEGLPDTVVYDQDRLFIVDENKGDLILTEQFRAYSSQRKFKLHFCRKSDPESKGKVENVVKYVKQNFLYNRSFSDIDTLNAEALAWLSRTANELPHSTTRKQPIQEWIIEKSLLHPYTPLVLQGPKGTLYAVRKDNSFSYKGNFYSLPSSTYQGRGSQVLLARQGTCIVVYNLEHQELCRHLISSGSGEKIINNDHRRDKSPAIQELEDQFCSLVSDAEAAGRFISAIRQDKPRYIRDQLLLLIQVAQHCQPVIAAQALAYCLKIGAKGAADFKSVVLHLNNELEDQQAPVVYLNPLNHKTPTEALIQPDTSSINDYDMF